MIQVDLKNPEHLRVWDAISSVYKRHDGNAPLNYVNVAEFVEAVLNIDASDPNEEDPDQWFWDLWRV